jgi:ABC-type uncharacterized transport system substrate-binding protein
VKKLTAILMFFILCLVFSSTSFSKKYDGKKILYIDSYHQGYAWSDGITKGVRIKMKNTGVQLKILRMDTKRNSDDAFKKNAARKAQSVINEFGPDVVIASDDNASKFLIKPYYKDADLPFVFCGVNWDAKVYGYPYKNVTGMVEVAPIPILIEQMELYAKGKRIGFIGPDIITAKKEAINYRKVFGLKIVEYYAKDFHDWKKGFKTLQNKVDMLIIASDGGLYNDYVKEYEDFVIRNSKIPSGTCYDFMSHIALIGVVKIAEEQGLWAADAALRILDGTSPSEIGIVENKRAKLFINKKIGDSMGIDLTKFPRLR